MLTYNNQFEIELKKLLDEETARLTANLVLGMAVPDFAEYKYQTGKLAGLKYACDQFEEVNVILAKR